MKLYDFSSWQEIREVKIIDRASFEPLVDAVFEGLERNMAVIDVGAAVGYYTIKAGKKVGVGGSVIAIEPHPDVYSLLVKNVEMHCLRNVITINKALGVEKGMVMIYESSSRGGTSTHFQRGRSIVVEMNTLDYLVNKARLTMVDLIKIDVQGDEVEVLRGASFTVRKYKPKVIVEVHPKPLPSLVSKVLKMVLRFLPYSKSSTRTDELNRSSSKSVGTFNKLMMHFVKFRLLQNMREVIYILKSHNYSLKD